MRRNLLRFIIGAVFVLATMQLTGCSTLPKTGPDTKAPLKVMTAEQGRQALIMTEDPIEGFNRGAYKFNYYFDEYLFLPIVRTYEFILPDYVEDRVSRFVDNIGEFENLYNNLFQLKMKSAGITLSRFAINTTVGIAGLWDPATGWGLKRQKEDLGQTLGHYGTGHGAYIVLPILGPSNARDTVGLVGDMAISNTIGPSAWVDDQGISTAYTVVNAVDRRHRVKFRYQQTGSPFEYELVRMMYTMKRELDIAK
jgi:phospholipid-binding lipoprotein MlaA